MEKKVKGRGRPKGSTKTTTNAEKITSYFEPGVKMFDLTEVDIAKLKFPIKAIYMGFGNALIYSITNVTKTTATIDATWLNDSFFNGRMRINLIDIEVIQS